MGKSTPPQTRFWAKVDRWDPDGCWEWTGWKTPGGYGSLYFPRPGVRRKEEYAHRLSHMWFVGPIPPGYHVDHLCRNRGCVNPKHLEAVTPRVNAQRSPKRPTHCKHGHPFSEANTYRYYYARDDQWMRQCRACHERTGTEGRRRRGIPTRAEWITLMRQRYAGLAPF